MSKIYVFLALFALLLAQNNYSQDKDNKIGVLYNYEISNSAGFSFGETKPVVYINILKNINRKFSAGLRLGIYAYKEKLETRLYDEYLPVYNGLNPGYYTVMYNDFKVNGLTYIAALAGKYKINSSFSLGLSAGIKNYKAKGYNAVFSFGKSGNSYPLIISLGSASETGNDKNITRAYGSVSVDYNINRLTVGIYGDNIYSVGLNFGLIF